MSACPKCGGSASRQGTKSRRVLELGPDGLPMLKQARVQRWQCSRCRAFYSTGIDPARPRALATIAARDLVAEACFDAGYAEAAARFGIDEKTARSLWFEWAAPRELDLPVHLPGVMGLHILPFAGSDRALVTDIENLSVVEVLRSANSDDVTSWLDRMDVSHAHTVAIPPFQPFRAAINAKLPGVRLAICPSHAAMALLRASLHALRTLRRLLGRGTVRNAKEAPRTFARRRCLLSEAERGEMEGWDDRAIVLYAAKEQFLDALTSSDASEARMRLDAAQKAFMAVPGASAPTALLSNWAKEIAEGAGNQAFNIFSQVLAKLIDAWSASRPKLPFDLARGLAVLKDGPRIYTGGKLDPANCFNLGVALNDLEALFSVRSARTVGAS